MPPLPRRGSPVVHTLVWLAIIACVTWFFYVYMQREHNPNPLPRVTGAGDTVLKRNRAGHFVAGGAINGRAVTFLVDTGATWISVPRPLADELGLRRGVPIQLMTAAGLSQGYATRLKSVDLASLHLEDASAVVADALDPEVVLLGMNFLRHLEITQRGDELILRPLPKPPPPVIPDPRQGK